MPCDPLRDLRAWQERLERLAHPHQEPWTPPIDVYETSSAYVVSIEVPGVPRDHVELSVEDNRLTVRGRRPESRTRDEAMHYHLVERGYGTFARTFEFGQKIDADTVSADLAEGVLTVTLPKLSPPPPRRIAVR